MTAKFEILTPVEISYRQIMNTLQSGFDSGIAYWAELADTIEPSDDDLYSGSKWDADSIIPYAVSKGGAIMLRDVLGDEDGQEGQVYTLDLESVERGLKAMASGNPYQFGLLMNEQGDCITGDVLIQFCLFGEEKYG